MRDLDHIFRYIRLPYVLPRWDPFMRGRDGEFYSTLLLHPHADDREAALVHEALHGLYPLAPESEIKRRERAIVKSLTNRERRRIERILATVR